MDPWDMLVGGSPLAQVLDAVLSSPAAAGMEPRASQRDMMAEVLLAIEQRHNVSIEAPCGTGKSLAYLLPAVLDVARKRLAGQSARVVIATANLALQQQLLTKDLPMVAKLLGVELTFAGLKGRQNYLCVDAAEDAALLGSQPAEMALRWYRNGGSGDREDAPSAAQSKWADLSVESDGCLRDKCLYFKECPAMKAKELADGAAVVVVSHAYLARAAAGLLKNATVLIADEAHELEDWLRRALSLKLTPSAGKHWAQRVEKYLGPGAGDQIGVALRAISDVAKRSMGNFDVRLQRGWCPDALAENAELALGMAAQRLSDVPDDMGTPKRQALIKQLDRLSVRVNAMVGVPDGWVAWVENDKGSPVVQLCMTTAFAPKWDGPTILTSATLDEPAARAMELDARYLSLPSPWPLQDMARAYVPLGAPDTDDSSWPRWAAATTVQIVREVDGRCLVLSSSWANMRQLHNALVLAGVDVRMQGDGSRMDLINWLRVGDRRVVVGTRSMFQGVDVSGIKAVILDKVPFPGRSPLEDGIGEDIRKRGGDPFRDRTLRQASHLLRQAAGRLIRGPGDRGVVVVLDPRVMRARYAGNLQQALRPLPLSSDAAVIGAAGTGAPWPADSIQAKMGRTPPTSE